MPLSCHLTLCLSVLMFCLNTRRRTNINKMPSNRRVIKILPKKYKTNPKWNPIDGKILLRVELHLSSLALLTFALTSRNNNRNRVRVVVAETMQKSNSITMPREPITKAGKKTTRQQDHQVLATKYREPWNNSKQALRGKIEEVSSWDQYVI